MDVNEKLLEDITRIAASAYAPKKVAFILGIKPSEFEAGVMDENNPVSIAYFKGLYSSELSVRESVLSLARSGSSPAQTTAIKIFDENKRELTRGSFPGFDED